MIQQKGRDPKWGDLTWQHRNWYSFVWICGDQIHRCLCQYPVSGCIGMQAIAKQRCTAGMLDGLPRIHIANPVPIQRLEQQPLGFLEFRSGGLHLSRLFDVQDHWHSAVPARIVCDEKNVFHYFLRHWRRAGL